MRFLAMTLLIALSSDMATDTTIQFLVESEKALK